MPFAVCHKGAAAARETKQNAIGPSAYPRLTLAPANPTREQQGGSLFGQKQNTFVSCNLYLQMK
jgi:hypothetical protein